MKNRSIQDAAVIAVAIFPVPICITTIHNLHFYLDIMKQMREAIEAGRFQAWRDEFLAIRQEGV
jgi:tRNA-guanine family transglycosylase